MNKKEELKKELIAWVKNPPKNTGELENFSLVMKELSFEYSTFVEYSIGGPEDGWPVAAVPAGIAENASWNSWRELYNLLVGYYCRLVEE